MLQQGMSNRLAHLSPDAAHVRALNIQRFVLFVDEHCVMNLTSVSLLVT
jgi:hypothetical protein